MKKSALPLIVLVLISAAGVIFFRTRSNGVLPDGNPITSTSTSGNPSTGGGQAASAVTVVADDLEIPWDIAFLPASSREASAKWDGSMLVTERPGDLLKIENPPAGGGSRKEIPIPSESALRQAQGKGEGGLLGITLHPDFNRNHYLYLYLGVGDGNGGTTNRVERYRFENDALSDQKVIVSGIPGATYHDGGRMEFGPDGMLYVTTGDATKGAIAQDKNSLGGKILRVKDDGAIPTDNPFPGSPVWSYGHRNPQGLAWDNAGRLWETEHGPTGENQECCRDEINLIEKGGSYGWPVITGTETRAGMISPALQSGASDTWAPASLAYYKGSLFFGGLRGAALFEAVLDGGRIKELKKHFDGEFGRIRTVRVGPDGMLYLTTSNRDGRWEAKDGGDKIIRVNPGALK